MTLTIKDYANDIALYDAFKPPLAKLSANEKEEVVDKLLFALNAISKQLGNINSTSYLEKRKLLHATLNILEPNYLKEKNIQLLNSLLQSELKEKSIIKVEDVTVKREIKGTKIGLYKGDITQLEINAIVNAANQQLLGCFQPLHGCIDNAIHSNAGVQLRDDCQIIMQRQQSLEKTGDAKITRAYNLPSKFVIHTVGPIVQNQVTSSHKTNLANSYVSCLEICREISQIRSIAFCCISTGVFGYPPQQAAETAYATVVEWLEKNPNQLDYLIFNVFSEKDQLIYESLINQK